MIAWLLWSCGANGACDSAGCDDTNHSAGTARLDDFGWGCDPKKGWWYDVYTVGLTASATVDIQESAEAPLAEHHALTERASDPYGSWDEWYAALAIVPRTEDYTSGSETRFGCGDEKNLTFQVAVTDTDGGALPCKAYGANPGLFPECEAAQ